MPEQLPRWIARIARPNSAVYPPYDVPFLGWQPRLFQSALIAVHPFSWKDESRRDRPPTWQDIARAVGMTRADVNRALLTGSGALGPEFADERAAAALERYSESAGIERPTEGRFPKTFAVTLAWMFSRIGASQVILRSEFGDELFKAEPTAAGIAACLRQIYAGAAFCVKRGYLVTVDWDSYFTPFFGSRSVLKSVAEKLESMFCERDGSHFHWTR
jgi:hypothetical protein